MSKLILSIIFLLSICPGAWATTYYVDNTIPDTYIASSTPDFTTYNHNTFATTGGTDIVFKTVADVNRLTGLQPGDSVLFRGGMTWYESLQIPASGTSGNMITFGTFGSGSVTFYPVTDLPSIWMSTKKYIDIEGPFIGDGGSSGGIFPVIGVVDGSDIILNNVTAQNSNSQPGISVYFSNPSYDCNNVLIQDFKVTHGRASASHGVFVSAANATYKVNNLHITHGSVDDVGGAGVRVSGNVTNSLIDYVSTNNVSQLGPDWGIYINGWRTALSTYVWTATGTNNEFYYQLTTPDVADGVIVTMFGSFSLGSGVGTLADKQFFVDDTHKLYVRVDGTHNPNNYSSFIAHRWASNNTISHCTATYTRNPLGGDGHGIGFEAGAKDGVVSYNVSHDNGENGNGSGFAVWGSANITFYNNVSYNNTTSGINAGGSNVLVYNNTCYHNYVNGNGMYAEISFTNGSSGIVKNNIGYNGLKYGLLVDSISVVTADHNLMFGNAAGDWGGFVTKGPTDIEADPRVISAPSDFQLQSTSPAKWAGVDVGLTTDFLGKLVHTPPSIGAFEFILGSPVNGLCGSSSGGSFTIAPTQNLCSAGAASAVTGGAAWSWTCLGSNGGGDAQCSAVLGHTLTVTVTGAGSVTSAPQNNGAIACSGSGNGCSATFPYNSKLTLTASPSSTTLLSTWSGACSGNDPTCYLTMDGDKDVFAQFAPYPPFKVIGALTGYFSAWGDFYGPVVNSGQVAVDVQAGAFAGPLLLNLQVDVTLKGGFSADFNLNPGVTAFAGPLTVGLGSLTVENVEIR